MNQYEKAALGLKLHTNTQTNQRENCGLCPYRDNDAICSDALIKDAFDLLHSQHETIKSIGEELNKQYALAAQYKWESEIAQTQLGEIGKTLGETMDDIVFLLDSHPSELSTAREEKKPEPRVMTFEEAKSAEYCVLEARGVGVMHQIVHVSGCGYYSPTLSTYDQPCFPSITEKEEYNRFIRCWTAWPTDEQRKAVPWK